jgi:DUF438 domain-containing protein
VKINKNTKILELIEKNPALIDVLVGMSPEFKKLKNPLLRKTLGRFATLEHAAEMSKIPYDELHRKVTECMIHAAGGEEKSDLSPEERARRMESLKGIIRGLHEGKAVEEQKAEFARLLGEVSASEIAEMEQSLIKEGISEEQIKKLCDVHVQVFAESFEGGEPVQVPAGHPVDTFRKENAAIGSVIDRMRPILADLADPPDEVTGKKWLGMFADSLEELAEIEYHYQRKENQLFPVLEDHGISGPSKVMWALHDDIRQMIKGVRQDTEAGNLGGIAADGMVLVTVVDDMIYKEENILFPMALETLSEADWGRVMRGGEEIGFTLIEPDTSWEPEEGPMAEAPPARYAGGEAPLWLSTGGLAPKQLDLILTSLPIDMTFVDADDKVQYYSANAERIFPRSPGIIGRSVQNCHPPDSVHIVQKILDSFRSGEKDTAEFWLQLGGKFIYIRYYAIRDEEGVYQGCLEVSQDVTGIRALEGERRLLDW